MSIIHLTFPEHLQMGNKSVYSRFFSELCMRKNCTLKQLQVVWHTDDSLLEINKKFLQHDYYTDIITFDYSRGRNITGEIHISLDRCADNAEQQRVSLEEEIKRVLIHGLLHLCGLKDKTKEEQLQMRSEENKELLILNSLFSKK